MKYLIVSLKSTISFSMYIEFNKLNKIQEISNINTNSFLKLHPVAWIQYSLNNIKILD